MIAREKVAVAFWCACLGWPAVLTPAAVRAQTDSAGADTASTGSASGDGSASAGDGGAASDGSARDGAGPGGIFPEPLGTTGGDALTARPFFVGGGVGVTVGLSGYGAAFSIEEDVGYRFFGFEMGGGLDGAVWAGLSFGQAFGGSGFVLLQFDGRGGADFEVWDGGEMQLLVTPSIALGGAAIFVDFVDGLGNRTTSTTGAFDFQVSAQGELVLADGLLGVWLRPLSFEILIHSGVGAQYELLGGVNVRL